MVRNYRHILCVALYISNTYSQTPGYSLQENSPLGNSRLAAIRFERNVNTYLWNADANYRYNDSTFTVSLSDIFKSTFILNQDRSYRDEQNFLLNTTNKLLPYLSLAADVQSFILSDRQSLGNSNAGIHSGVVGVLYAPISNITLTPMLGMRYDKQQLEKDDGMNYRLYVLGDSLEFSGYRSQFSGQLNHSDLERRYFKNDVAQLYIATEFASGSSDSLIVHAMQNRNDFYVPTDTLVQTMFGVSSNIRARTDQLWNVQNILNYNINNVLNIQLITTSEARVISNKYRYKNLSNFNSIPFNTDVQEFGIGGTIDIGYRFENLQTLLGFDVSERDEKHLLERIDGLKAEDVFKQEKRVQEESRLDNSAFRRSIRSVLSMNLSSNDSLIVAGSANILQYDTPSQDNTDDRDELLINASIREFHRFSSAFSVALTSEVTLSHIVYLKKDKSANNNWNRIFRLSPEARYRPSERFRMFNRFEVLANYTVFDFEMLLPSVKSYSYRLVAFLDSTSYDMSTKVGIDFFTHVRIYERGELQWKDFSEHPLQRVEEVTFLPRIRYRIKNSLLFAVGFRSFAQKRYHYEKAQWRYENTFLSAGPTTDIAINLSPSSLIEIHGWKEFQRQSGGSIKEYSNISMNIRYLF